VSAKMTPTPPQRYLFDSRELALIVVLSSLGAVVSVPVGHAGNLLKTITGMPPGASQLLAGIHVLWLILAAVLVERRGAATMAGILKGLVEATLFSYHGILVLLISAVEGCVVDIILLPLDKNDAKSICIAGSLSSASNVAVLQFAMMLPLPSAVFASMYLASFVSGLIFAGYLGKRVIDVVSQNPLL
ncbi:MAG: ECF transporter S component, partial [Candidatus Bathyarchaeota archaeon]|nr:ECF transporter S component [Candidatus Bathyarchaeota archaeon]